ncbi:MAG: TaqI-like C-terminal specificity domain-containing protein [bacterium]
MKAPSVIKELVEHFQRNRDACHSPLYNETQLRREFLDRFFEELGWDVQNKQGYSEAYKDVVHEDAIKAGEGTKAPDYCFRIGGTRKFFVEAKKPAINIKEDPSPAFQLRRYAWSAKLPLSILTDFEEFAVYDCRIRPHQTDKASAARLIILTYEEYLEKWEEIASIFSHDAVLKGSFDKYAESKRRRGTAEVDDAFLSDIEMWRKEFAQNFALRNERLSQRELNFAVERTIDRIIFLRVCEDRGIEPYAQLRDLTDQRNIYGNLFQIFRRADDRYNSGLFHFQKETGRAEDPDELTPTLILDDKPLKEIIQGLYYPDSPYAFRVLSADILGQVYEQFLGKVIRLTEGHRAKVEDKPEVKKAGGVYYTPTYIVHYIVKHTVGKLLENKTPKEAAKLRILDPACGSGSFLIGAYQYLLDWHLEEYLAAAGLTRPIPPASRRGREGLPPFTGGQKGGRSRGDKRGVISLIYQTTGGQWRLTPAERKRILLNNIHGVDIDPQAVEVTKLSLLLKVLEGESSESLNAQLKMFRQRALPDLASNIKCGNSLIGPDFYDHAQMELLDDEEKYRINAFDWNSEFPDIMKAGGFDAVIGNPPYVFGRDWKALNIGAEQKDYFRQFYRYSPYQLDMFSLFMERAHWLCRIEGRIGQIVPNVWLTNTYSSLTRAFIFSKSSNLSIVTPRSSVFADITVDTVIYTLTKSETPGETFELLALDNGSVEPVAVHPVTSYSDGQHPIATAASTLVVKIAERLKTKNAKLGDVAEITRGVHAYRIGGYGRTAFGTGHQTSRDVRERPYHSKRRLKNSRPFVYGKDLRRFAPIAPEEFILYGTWLAEPRDPKFFDGERIYSRKILGDRLVVTLDSSDSIADQQVYISKPLSAKLSPKYLAGLIGSRLMAFFIRAYFDEANQAFPQIKVTQLRDLPIRPINFSDKKDKARHDKMVELVERMLKLHKELPKAKTPDEKTRLERQIAATDRQIDNLVYELYGLTEEEIKIVEGGMIFGQVTNLARR